jgi:hypothetical protein
MVNRSFTLAGDLGAVMPAPRRPRGEFVTRPRRRPLGNGAGGA